MKPLLTYEDVAKICKASKWYVMRQVKEGKLQPVRLGTNVRFQEEEVQRFIEQLLIDQLEKAVKP